MTAISNANKDKNREIISQTLMEVNEDTDIKVSFEELSRVFALQNQSAPGHNLPMAYWDATMPDVG